MHTSLVARFEGDDAKILSALSVNLLLFAVGILLYWILHTLLRRHYYQNPLVRSKGPPAAEAGGMVRAFAWVKPVLLMSDDDVERYAGLDALVFLHFIKLVHT
jgi:hypothetical protein